MSESSLNLIFFKIDGWSKSIDYFEKRTSVEQIAAHYSHLPLTGAITTIIGYWICAIMENFVLNKGCDIDDKLRFENLIDLYCLLSLGCFNRILTC